MLIRTRSFTFSVLRETDAVNAMLSRGDNIRWGVDDDDDDDDGDDDDCRYLTPVTILAPICCWK